MHFVKVNLTNFIEAINEEREILKIDISPDDIIEWLQKLDIDNVIQYFIYSTYSNWQIVHERNNRKFYDLVLPFFTGFSNPNNNVELYFKDEEDVRSYKRLLLKTFGNNGYNHQMFLSKIDSIFTNLKQEEKDCFWNLLKSLVTTSINFIHFKREPVIKETNGVDRKGYCKGEFMEEIKFRPWAAQFGVKLLFNRLE